MSSGSRRLPPTPNRHGGTDMRVLLAGASGAIGMPLIRQLHAADHDVLAIHKTAQGRERLAAAGATPIQVDVLNRPDMLRALRGQRADAVISELTALKKPPASHKDMAATDRLRTEGTANLIAAAGHRYSQQPRVRRRASPGRRLHRRRHRRSRQPPGQVGKARRRRAPVGHHRRADRPAAAERRHGKSAQRTAAQCQHGPKSC